MFTFKWHHGVFSLLQWRSPYCISRYSFASLLYIAWFTEFRSWYGEAKAEPPLFYYFAWNCSFISLIEKISQAIFNKAEKFLSSSSNEWGFTLATSEVLNPVWAQLITDPFLSRILLRYDEYIYCCSVC